jgi:hypothetical protein
MNCWLKFRNSRKDCISLTVFGCGYFLTVWILSLLIRTLLTSTMYLRKSTSFLWNLHFSGFTCRLN